MPPAVAEPEVDWDAAVAAHGGQVAEATQQSQPQAPNWDELAKASGAEILEPESAVGSFLRGAKANLASGVGGALGALGAGAVATPESAGLATIPAAIAGAAGGSALGQKAYEKLIGEEAFRREQAQLEANRLAGHELAGGAGEMLPALLPAGGAGKWMKEGAGVLSRVGAAAEAGARLGAAGEAQKQVETGQFDPMAFVTHPVEEAVKFGPVGFIPHASTILGQVLKGVPDAAVMTLSSNLWDHFAHDKPLDLSGIKDETGKAIPSFLLLNALTSVLHGGAGAATKMLPKAQEGMTLQQMAEQGLHEAAPVVPPEAQQKSAEIQAVVSNPEAQALAPEATAALAQKHDELVQREADAAAEKVQESIKASEQERQALDEEAKRRQKHEEAMAGYRQMAQQREAIIGQPEKPITPPTDETPAATTPQEPEGLQPAPPEAPAPLAEPAVAPEAPEAPETSVEALKPPTPSNAPTAEAERPAEPLEPAVPAQPETPAPTAPAEEAVAPKTLKRTLNVAGEERTVELTPDKAAEFDRLRQEHNDYRKRKAQELQRGLIERDQYESAVIGNAHRTAAKLRELTGEFTATEAAARRKREASNYIGKEVSVEGKPAKVVANAYGRVKVRFEDGSERSFPKEKIQPKTLSTEQPTTQENATRPQQVEKGVQPEREHRNEGGKTAEAGGGNRLQRSEESKTQSQGGLGEGIPEAGAPRPEPERPLTQSPATVTGTEAEKGGEIREDVKPLYAKERLKEVENEYHKALKGDNGRDSLPSELGRSKISEGMRRRHESESKRNEISKEVEDELRRKYPQWIDEHGRVSLDAPKDFAFLADASAWGTAKRSGNSRILGALDSYVHPREISPSDAAELRSSEIPVEDATTLRKYLGKDKADFYADLYKKAEEIPQSPESRQRIISDWLARNPKSAAELQRQVDEKSGRTGEPSITLDNQGRIIPLDERFNPESVDIRYSKEEPKEIKPTPVKSPPLAMSEEGRAEYKEARGEPPPNEPERKAKSDRAVSANIRMRVAREGTNWMEERAKEIIKDPNKVVDNDVTVMGHWKKLLDERKFDLMRKINDGRTSPENKKAYQKEIDELNKKIDLADQGSAQALSSGGRLLRSGRKVFGDNFTVEGLTREIKAAKGGKDLTPKQEKTVDEISKEGDAVQLKLLNVDDEFTKDTVDSVAEAAKKWAQRSKQEVGATTPSDPEHVANVKEFLKKRGFASGGKIRVVDEGPQRVRIKGKEYTQDWWGRLTPKGIEINARNIRDEAHFNRILNHELVHGVAKDPEVLSKRAKLLRGLTADEHTELKDWLDAYKKGEKEDEVIPKVVEIILARPEGKSFLKTVGRVLKKITGVDLLGTDDIHQIARDILAKAEKGYESERFTKAGVSYAKAAGEAVRGKYDLAADRAALAKEMAEWVPGEPIPHQTLERALRIAAHNELGEEDFLSGIHTLLDTGNPETTPTREDIQESLKDWVREKLPTKSSVTAKLEQTKEQIAQSTDDKEVEKLQREYDRLKKQLDEGNFVKPSPKQKELSEQAQNLLNQVKLLRKRKATAIIEARQEAQPAAYKVGDFLARLKRFMILSSPISAAKLGAAAMGRSGLMPIEDFIGSAYAKGLGAVGRKATIEGRFSPSGYARGIAKAFTKGIMDAKETFKEGSSALDRSQGAAYSHGGILNFFGRLHGAIKAPLKRFAFESAMEKQVEAYMQESGGIAPSEDAMMRFATRAYQHSQRQIFMQDNKLSQAWTEITSKFDRAGGVGKLAATTMRLLLPIVKVPSNIVGEAFTYVGGVPAGLYNLAKLWKAGMQNVTPEQADMVVRQLKKGSIGGAFMLLGYMNPQLAGGYYQKGDKNRKPGDAKVGQLQFGGVDIPKWASHIPLAEALQIGSTLRRVSDSHDTKGGVKGLGVGAQAALWGLTSELPFIDQAMRLGELGEQWGRDKLVRDLVKSEIEPAAMDWAARQTDVGPSGDTRKVRINSLSDALKSGVPGLRQTLPSK